MNNRFGKLVEPNSDYGIWAGFNDLNTFLPNTSKVLCTGSPHWDKPPRLGESADVLIFDTTKQQGIVIGSTLAINYPIGARPQVIVQDGKSYFLINNIRNSCAVIDVYSQDGTLVRSVEGCHHWCTTRDLSISFCADMLVSQKLGGYGYVFGATRRMVYPYRYSDSIVLYSHRTRDCKTIVTGQEIKNSLQRHLAISDLSFFETGYFTHILLSPSEKKLAFLFRCWLRDGGILTALFTIDLHAANRKPDLQLVGQLSHFTWLDDNGMMIYAYQQFHSRSSRIVLNRYSQQVPLSRIAKGIANLVKPLLARRRMPQSKSSSQGKDSFQRRNCLPCFIAPHQGSFSYLPIALPASDGHPSLTTQLSKSLLVSDTYPDETNTRTLFCLDLETDSFVLFEKHNEYRPSRIHPYKWVSRYTDLPSYAQFSISQQSFTRSGLHCDLHPFWNNDMTRIGFHVSSCGYRTIYSSDIK